MKIGVKRIGIFVCYDSEGIVDDYVVYYLQNIVSVLEKLVIVVNGEISEGGKRKLERISSSIFFRENNGLDAAAWKLALTEYIGWDEISTFDEIVLFNGTVFGPFIPFKDIFDKMEKRAVDFWGITCHWKKKNVSTHIQSYCIVVRRKMHTSNFFREYWENLPMFCSWQDVVDYHEIQFTEYFSQHGFSWDVLINTRKYYDNITLEGYNALFLNPFQLLSLQHCPVLKIKPFGHVPDLRFRRDDELQKSLEYIHRETKYPVDLIWQHILRKFSMSQLQESIGLQYVVPENSPKGDKETAAMNKTLLVVFGDGEGSQNNSFPNIKKIELRGRTICSLLLEKRKELESYDYVCFLQERESANWNMEESIHEGWILGVLRLFMEHPRMGMAISMALYRDEGTSKDSGTEEFWMRKNILRELWNRKQGPMETDVSQIVPFLSKVAQEAGYYTGCVMRPREAVLEWGVSRALARQWKTEREKSVRYIFPYHLFSAKERIVIYGAGKVGQEFYRQAKQYGDVEIVAIVDANAAHMQIRNPHVEKIDRLHSLEFDSVLVAIKNEEMFKQAKETLLSMGIKERQVKWAGKIYEQADYWSWYIKYLREMQGRE